MGNFKSVALAGLLVLTACGGDDKDEELAVDAGPQVDAMPQNVCTLIDELYGDLGVATGTAIRQPIDEDLPDGPQYLSLVIPLNEDATPDVLHLELWEEVDGPFAGGLKPITLTLNLDQADLISCSACAFIAADVVPGEPTKFNMAYTGELIIETVDTTPDTGSIKGSLTGIKFQEVSVDIMGQKPIAGGCKSVLEKVQFDFAVALPPA